MNEKLRELLNKINACKTEVKTLAEAGKIEDAKAKKAELEEMQARFDILKDLDDNPSPQNPIPAGEPKDNAIHAFAEAARHRFRNEAGTNNESTPADGGYTVPEDIQTRKWKETEFTLRNLVATENVTTPTGARTYMKKADHTGFMTVEEAGKIGAKAGPQFERITYKIEKRGGFLPVTNELLADSDANITSVLIEWLGKESVATDNANILNLVKSGNFKKMEGVDSIDQIKEIINITLGQLYAPNTTIVTNDDGLHWLDTLKDNNGRYLLSADANSASPFERRVAVGGRMIPLVVVPNQILKSESDGKFPMIIGDMKEAIRIYDRQQISIMTSNTAAIGDFNAFEQDMTLFRALLRNDYQVIDRDAVVYATHSPKSLRPDVMQVQSGDAAVKGLATSKKVEDFMDGEAEIMSDGSVIASFKHVKDFTDFSKSEKDGYFFPFSLGEECKGKTIKVQRTAPTAGTEKASPDLDWVLKVEKDKVFTVKADDELILTLNFAKSTFAPEE